MSFTCQMLTQFLLTLSFFAIACLCEVGMLFGNLVCIFWISTLCKPSPSTLWWCQTMLFHWDHLLPQTHNNFSEWVTQFAPDREVFSFFVMSMSRVVHQHIDFCFTVSLRIIKSVNSLPLCVLNGHMFQVCIVMFSGH